LEVDMIEANGGMIPFLCHVFLILFGGFFGLNFAFNKNFAQKNFGFDNIQAAYMGRPLGFLMTGCVLMAIFALFQIAGVTSANEVFGAIFIFTVLAFVYNISLVMKILPTHDGNDHDIKNAIRPLIPMVVILIRYFTL
tara:strand:+ start:688 stop:1101 length:414 start_codon:yes stop_codon:yes gene_type:complete